MKAFLLALVFFGVALVATSYVFRNMIDRPAVETFSMESARPEHGGGEHRKGWEPGV
jgi:hypothetical protein